MSHADEEAGKGMPQVMNADILQPYIPTDLPPEVMNIAQMAVS